MGLEALWFLPQWRNQSASRPISGTLIIVPEMIGSVVGVYIGKTFNQVEIEPEMIGHYLGDFSITYKPVKHGSSNSGSFASTAFADAFDVTDRLSSFSALARDASSWAAHTRGTRALSLKAAALLMSFSISPSSISNSTAFWVSSSRLILRSNSSIVSPSSMAFTYGSRHRLSSFALTRETHPRAAMRVRNTGVSDILF